MPYKIYIFSLIFAFLGGTLAQLLHFPIPWLLGSLLMTALLKINGVSISCPVYAKNIGLTILGLALGLYFTPEMLKLIADNAFGLLIGLLFSIFLGIFSSIILYYWGRVDFETAWFASAVGGASEMSNLAEKHHAQVDKVASAHSIRILIVVLFVPFFYKTMGWTGFEDVVLTSNKNVHLGGIIFLATLAWIAVKIFERFKLPNPWTLAPIFVSLLLTANNFHLSSIPPSLLALSQVLLGWSLGNKFKPGFFKTAPYFLRALVVSIICALLLTFVVADYLTRYTAFSFATLYLGLAPGGVAEMTLTAKDLHLNVPLVTAFHLVRMLGIIMTVGIFYQIIKKLKLYYDERSKGH